MYETVFYLDTRSGKFELLYTADNRYSNLFGVHVGTSTAIAEHALHRLVYVGCLAPACGLAAKTAFLEKLLFKRAEGITSFGIPHYHIHLVGGQVGVIVSQRFNPAYSTASIA